MCTIGDIILVEEYKHNGKKINKHSFIVLNDEAGRIQGLDYNLICNVMSSFKSDEQKKKKLCYPGNFPIVPEDYDDIKGNDKNGYIKADQLYYFNKDKINFIVIGRLNEDIYNLLIEFIENDLERFEQIIDNL